MCIYCGTNKYRKIYTNHFGPIPTDVLGRKYEIHHIDGNHQNNDPTNLKAVTIQEHYDIHLEQMDWAAAMRIAAKMKLPSDELSKLATLNNLKRSENGVHPWQNTTGAKFRKNNANIRVTNGTHNFQGERNPNKRRILEGTHNFLDKDNARIRALKQIENGVHNFLNKEHARERLMKRINNGTHNFLQKATCPHCAKVGMQVNMKRYHFDNCKFKCN